MAEVLPPPMQSSTSTITLLHSRPASADAFQTSQPYHQASRLTQAPRSMYNGHNQAFKGSSGPVQPYAFRSTPNLRQENRTSSAPNSSSGPVSNHRTVQSASAISSDASSPSPAKDDSSQLPPRTVSLINISPNVPDLSLTNFDTSSKESVNKTYPERYRRPTGKRVDSNSSNPSARADSPSRGDENVQQPANVGQSPWIQRQTSFDNIALQRSGRPESLDRYRGRSLTDTQSPASTAVSQASAGAAQRPATAQDRGSILTSPSIASLVPNGNGDERKVAIADSEPQTEVDSGSAQFDPTKQEVVASPRSDAKIHVPPRASSEAVKRLAAPSPLSRQTNDMDTPPGSPAASPTKTRGPAATAQAAVPVLSPAAQHLAAVSDRDLNKGMKSRLRRAFSFGSAQELRRVGIDNNIKSGQQTRDQDSQQPEDGLDAEQLEIARRQEAAGIGAGIYSGQGGFTGSTDNLSISSTASSASIMLRKMGRGAKKSARSIKGLFRPKSVIGVPAADGPIQLGSSATVEASVGQVSMVTVEAERHNVNVNAHPDERTGGGTAFPKLERNSMDAATIAAARAQATSEAPDAHLRRSIVGNEADRAEVLAAVRKGILKRSGTASPTASPIVQPSEGAGLPQVLQLTESPSASMPGTPKEVAQGRSSSAPVANGDYFATRTGLAKSMPTTPNGSVRSISFSPRIQFHDAWSSTEYDRRGEIATCNRLTPLLAQQIKEELNTFKMEMEVHELSKPHTHFF